MSFFPPGGHSISNSKSSRVNWVDLPMPILVSPYSLTHMKSYRGDNVYSSVSYPSMYIFAYINEHSYIHIQSYTNTELLTSLAGHSSDTREVDLCFG